MSLFARRHWPSKSVLLLGAAIAFVGCYDDPPIDEGTGGKVNTGGKSNTGGKGPSSGGTDVTGPAGAGGEGAGAASGTGGGTNGGSGGKTNQTGGKGGGGKAGGGGGNGGTDPGGAECGNMNVDAGEECDDGNTKNGDGCSSQCTSKCEECEATYCDYGDYGDIEAMCFTMGDDVALAGPALGAPRAKLCTELVECVRKSGCMKSTLLLNPFTTPIFECFCGPGIDCTQPSVAAEGPCVAEFQRAAETEDNNGVLNRMPEFAGQTFPELGLAVGRASAVLQYCDLNACSQPCYFNEESDACDRCILGPDAHLTFDPGGAGVCGEDVIRCEYDVACSAVIACVREANCSQTSILDCYADSSGPCADAIETLAATTVVAEVKARLSPTGQYGDQLSRAVRLLACMKSSCSAECF